MSVSDSSILRGAGRGAITGAIVSIGASVQMLSANGLTINRISALVVLVLWAAAGAAVGFAMGALGGRAARIIRRPTDEGAMFLALLTTGHLFLPPGLGVLATALFVLYRLVRARVLPRLGRLDVAAIAGLVALATSLPLSPSADPPRLRADSRLDAGTPLPGSVPVTVSVREQVPFPDVPAMHVPLRALEAQRAGRLAALRTGRLPDRTRAGRGVPRLVPGSGGLGRWPQAPGSLALAHLFRAVEDPAGTPFAPAGTLQAIAEAAGIPVLTGPPAAEDPPMFLRLLVEAPADRETAERIAAGSAWIDVSLAADGGHVALAGEGFRLAKTDGVVSLVDVTPTALHLLGLAVPRAVDGRVLTELLESPGPGARPLRYRALVAPRDDPKDEEPVDAADAPGGSA